MGSCGTAAYRGKTVIVSDIAVDPLWADFRHVALKHGLRSCWSVPILARVGEDSPAAGRRVLGTFALYQRHVSVPQRNDVEVVASAAHLAGIAVHREASERLIRANEARFRTFVDHATDAFFLLTDTATIADVNHQACSSLGYSREELIGQTPALFSENRKPESIRQMMPRLRGGETVVLETCHRRKDGSSYPAEIRIRAFQAEGRPMAMAIARDMTERLCSEGALRESEERYRLLTDHANVVLWEGCPATFDFTYVSEYAERLLGYPRATWYEPGFWTAHLHPNDREAALALCMEYTRAGKDHRFEYRMIRADGAVIWVEDVVNVVARGKETAIQGVLIDITERKDAERKLVEAVRSKAEALALLDTLQNEAPIGLAFVDAEFRFVRCNEALAQINGRTVAEHIGRTVEEIVPVLWPHIQPIYRDIMSGRGPIVNQEMSGETASSPGETRFWLGSFFPVSIGDEILGIGLIVSEITERKRMEETLRTGEIRNRAILNALPDIMFRMDGDGCIFDYHAPQSEELYATPDLLLGKKVEDVLPRETGELIQLNNRRTLQTRQSQLFEYDLELPHRGKLSFEARMVVSGENETITVVRDVTGRKRLEEQLRRSQKLEAVGRLAGGIAHDFNNLLTVVTGYSQLLLSKQPSDHSTRDALTAIRDAGQRAATLVRQLLAFSRGQVLQPIVLDLNDVLLKLENLIRRLLDRHVELTIRRAEALEFILADRSQIEQVVVNLVLNARDALPNGGRIFLQTRNVVISAARAEAIGDLHPGRYVQFTATDNGEGMSPEVLSHLFEPFFTTKEVGKGTGLGLAVVHGIVKQSGGHVEIASELGAGTTVTILIPAAEG